MFPPDDFFVTYLVENLSVSLGIKKSNNCALTLSVDGRGGNNGYNIFGYNKLRAQLFDFFNLYAVFLAI